VGGCWVRKGYSARGGDCQRVDRKVGGAASRYVNDMANNDIRKESLQHLLDNVHMVRKGDIRPLFRYGLDQTFAALTRREIDINISGVFCPSVNGNFTVTELCTHR
jgi:hypothetical protein